MSESEVNTADASGSFTYGTEVMGDIGALGHPALAEMVALRAAEAEKAAAEAAEQPEAVVTQPLDYVAEM